MHKQQLILLKPRFVSFTLLIRIKTKYCARVGPKQGCKIKHAHFLKNIFIENMSQNNSHSFEKTNKH